MAEQRHIFHTENLTVSFIVDNNNRSYLGIARVHNKGDEISDIGEVGGKISSLVGNTRHLYNLSVSCKLDDYEHLILVNTLLKYRLNSLEAASFEGAALDNDKLKNICLLSRKLGLKSLTIEPRHEDDLIHKAFTHDNSLYLSEAWYSLPKGLYLTLEPDSIEQPQLKQLIECAIISEIAGLKIQCESHFLETAELIELGRTVPEGLQVIYNGQNLAEIESSLPKHPLLEKLSKATTPAESAAAAWAKEQEKYGIHI